MTENVPSSNLGMSSEKEQILRENLSLPEALENCCQSEKKILSYMDQYSDCVLDSSYVDPYHLIEKDKIYSVRQLFKAIVSGNC